MQQVLRRRTRPLMSISRLILLPLVIASSLFVEAGPASASSTVSGVSAGVGNACAVFTNGSVKCWGSNGPFSPMFPFQPEVLTRPVAVSGVNGATSVAVGSGSACAIVAGGKVKCWGGNHATTYNVLGITSAVQISSGGAAFQGTAFCVVTKSRAVLCWNNRSPFPTPILGITNATSVSAGGDGACARLTIGQVKCWSWPTQGATNCSGVSCLVTGLSGIIQVSSSSWNQPGHCAVSAAGSVICWGSNSYGEIGNGVVTGGPVGPTVATSRDVKQVSSGHDFNCGVRYNNVVQCWGKNNHGQLGSSYSPSTDYSPSKGLWSALPLNVNGLLPSPQVSAGDDFACALTTTRLVECWGKNNRGQLGDGTTVERFTPAPVNF